MTALPAIAKRTPNTLHGVAASVWNRIVVKNWFLVDPQQLAIHFQSSDPDLYRAISKIIGTDVIYDIYYVKGWAGSKKPKNLVLEMLVAWVYKNTLELGDISFLDPTRPISPESRRFPDQTHKGLGLLPVLMKNLSARAKELKCDRVTLVAARRDQVGLFKRCGFRVEDSASGHSGMDLGVGIPMELDI